MEEGSHVSSLFEQDIESQAAGDSPSARCNTADCDTNRRQNDSTEEEHRTNRDVEVSVTTAKNTESASDSPQITSSKFSVKLPPQEKREPRVSAVYGLCDRRQVEEGYQRALWIVVEEGNARKAYNVPIARGTDDYISMMKIFESLPWIFRWRWRFSLIFPVRLKITRMLFTRVPSSEAPVPVIVQPWRENPDLEVTEAREKFQKLEDEVSFDFSMGDAICFIDADGKPACNGTGNCSDIFNVEGYQLCPATRMRLHARRAQTIAHVQDELDSFQALDTQQWADDRVKKCFQDFLDGLDLLHHYRDLQHDAYEDAMTDLGKSIPALEISMKPVFRDHVSPLLVAGIILSTVALMVARHMGVGLEASFAAATWVLMIFGVLFSIAGPSN